jgi:hypothetical protein
LAAALELTILITGKEPGRLPRVAVRWLERYVQECEPMLANVMLAVSALSALAGEQPAEAIRVSRALIARSGQRFGRRSSFQGVLSTRTPR